jgi:hypothetical protein
MPLLQLILLVFHVAFAGGGISGGGTDHLPPDFGAAWYLDSSPARHVKVCILQDEKEFPMEPSEVAVVFQKALHYWKDYIEEKGINSTEILNDEDEVEQDMKLVTDFRFISSCDAADLKLYLGLVDEKIKEIKADLNDPAAFAFRESYDSEKGWGKGILWLSGYRDSKFIWNLNDQYNLLGVLIHELGHIFGNQHIDGTIMDQRFANNLEDVEVLRNSFYWNLFKYSMTHIDQSSELVQGFEENLSFKPGKLWMKGSKAEAATYKFLTGKNLPGDVSVILSAPEARRNGNLVIDYTLVGVESAFKSVLTFFPSTANFNVGQRIIMQRYRTSTSDWGFRETNSDARLLSISGFMSIRNERYPILLEGVVSPFEFQSYQGDEKENSYASRKLPHKISVFDKENRYVIYGSFEWPDIVVQRPEETGTKIRRFQTR